MSGAGDETDDVVSPSRVKQQTITHSHYTLSTLWQSAVWQHDTTRRLSDAGGQQRPRASRLSPGQQCEDKQRIHNLTVIGDGILSTRMPHPHLNWNVVQKWPVQDIYWLSSYWYLKQHFNFPVRMMLVYHRNLHALEKLFSVLQIFSGFLTQISRIF